ncbi:MAG: hypothetical protein FWG58_00495, partial [Methanomassiliicoccaceae archaeon]|nr:hypothetical protein [Methanomassiliicoccaceae archaeon]
MEQCCKNVIITYKYPPFYQLQGINMGYEELFPKNDLSGWHANAAKRFASPFVDNFHDRIDVDPIILSNAAVQCGFTIRDFYEKPELGIHCVGYIS